MFESAIRAAEVAAEEWTPDCADPTGTRCCRLCLHRYRVLVLDGPLRLLPHAVAHAAVVEVDDLIAGRVNDAWEQLEWEAWTALLTNTERELELTRRARATSGALLHVALQELAAAAPRLREVRRSRTEPAIAAFLDRHRVSDLPPTWA